MSKKNYYLERALAENEQKLKKDIMFDPEKRKKYIELKQKEKTQEDINKAFRQIMKEDQNK